MPTYLPAGPTIARLHASTALSRSMAGPIGSAKTTAGVVGEPIITVLMQRPDTDGIRSASVGVLRDTYRNIYATLVPTWQKFFPPDVGHFVGSDDRPARHRLEFPAPHLDKHGQPTGDLGLCRLDVQFRALGSNTVEAVCRGWELMGACLDEEDLMPAEARPFLMGRVMRGGDVRYRVTRGVWGQFNKPDTDHPMYGMCVEDPPDGFEFFDQPAGLLPGGPPYRTNPLAENLAQLDRDYYPLSAQGQPEWYIRRMLRNQWGASVAGDPIFENLFDPDRHVSDVELEPGDGEEIMLGLDGGGTPAAVIMGRTPTGRRVIYAEVVITDPGDRRNQRLKTGVGPKSFADAIRDALYPRFRHCRITLGYGDPAAFYGADREAGEYSYMEIVGQVLDLPIISAPAQELHLRLEAVRIPLATTNRLDGKPGLMINPSCKFTRRGFSSDYRWEQRDPKQPGKALKQQKSATSHVMEGLQYVLVGDQGRAAIVAGARYDRHPVRAPTAMQEASGSLWREHEGRVADKRAGDSYRSDFDPWRS